MNAKLIRPHKLFQLFLHLIVMPNAALQYKNSLLFFLKIEVLCKTENKITVWTLSTTK